ncbi:hypothetical protein B0A52_07702 [Exophiala mesophila]|uniref:Uncharacterized protein n=1 Tax=Exophiala mesophila TaxID=212818 RepID=A0A438MVI8_EXOME|nr:hypothetical protein B0A52_07702 [Exophiala mesophila]
METSNRNRIDRLSHTHGSISDTSTPLSSAVASPRERSDVAAAFRDTTSTLNGTGPNIHAKSSASGTRVFHPDASLVLIGIRASGKRSLGFIAATALGRRFVTEDHYFHSINGLSRQDYLKIHGSEQFHKQDVESSKRMLEDNKHGCVIDCGLGSLTSGLQVYLRKYCETNPVVFVVRDMGRIKSLLQLDDRSAKLLEHGNTTHRKCSNFEFYNLEDESTVLSEHDAPDRASPNYSFKLRNLQADFSRFVRFITGASVASAKVDSPFSIEVPTELRPYSHMLRVRLSDFADGRIDFAQLESAGDVLGIYVDQWRHNTVKVLNELLATARRTLETPILLSASRRLSETASIENYLAVLQHGLRLGVEYMFVDLDLEEKYFAALKQIKGHTKLIGSYVSPRPTVNSWKDPKWKELYFKGRALELDLVRLLNMPSSRQDNDTLRWFIEELRNTPEFHLSPIAYNAGLLGRTSQILNPMLTSVTHPSLPTHEINYQNDFKPMLSSRLILAALFENFVFDRLKFYIVGGDVSGSLSPVMHNAAYEHLGLQHHYSTRNIGSWDDIAELAKDDYLGGLSIVQPYKVKVVPNLTALSGHANAIGAVNTLVPLRSDPTGAVASLQNQAQNRNRGGTIAGWFGENTDYIGIMNCVSRSLSPRNAIQPKTTALVIGAGGMARAAVYAMLQLGCKAIFVFNRTVANTKAMADHFNEWANRSSGTFEQDTVKVLESISQPWPPDFAFPTIVVSCVTHELIDGNPGAHFELPDSWRESPSGGVVVEMAYMTKETPLLAQMKQYRAANKRPWVLVDGIETLLEQAYAQFETMTGRKAPKRCMSGAVYSTIKQNTSYLVDGEEFLH